ncbi:Oxidoreductase, molybdopterin-binding domain-containing protein [Xylariales sp. AK1849]|nr:Oxidoreductase, molybdopterin-binding domain-containing protein [Xylariales sp. AK1849]
MPTSRSGLLGQEALKLARRPQLPLRSFQAYEIRHLSASSTKTFSFQTASRAIPSRTTTQSPPNFRGVRPLQALAAGGGLLTVLFSTALFTSHDQLEVQAREAFIGSSEPRESAASDGLPRYHLSEVKKHGPKSSRPWVTYEDKVYDITDWLPAHPGGEVILCAAGGSIEPYWDIFTIHKAPYVREILEQYVVGLVHADDLKDGRARMDHIEDPFVSDPTRDPRLRQLTTKPCNAETAGEDLAGDFLTPNEVFYVRNHMWVPVVEDTAADSHGITVELPDGHVKTYTVRDLKAKFKQHTVTAVLQCSGNRRKNMTDYARKTNGLQWDVGAISCARWEGVRLRDVLADAGLAVDDAPDDAQHVQFSGLEAYGASIPIHSALDPRGDVLLALKMNDMPLPRDHGFPVRVVVPGTVAARCVKWVNKIVVSDEESNTSWQRRDYKSFGPNEVRDLDWDKYKSIQEMPITSAITRARVQLARGRDPPAAVSTNVATGSRTVELEGYAYSGGGREIQRVDVSLDGGKTWDQAQLLDDSNREKGNKKWCWKRWTYAGNLQMVDGGGLKASKMTFVVKATDDAYNTQPQSYESIYNVRGNLATAWHRLEFDASAEDGDLVKAKSRTV